MAGFDCKQIGSTAELAEVCRLLETGKAILPALVENGAS
jgi:hypothetical protein